MTPELAQAIINKSVRCTHATLLAFGIDKVPTTGSGTLNYLTAAGYTIKPLAVSGVRLDRFKFSKEKSYHIKTKGHALALINGVLIDTQTGKLDSRKIEFAWEVIKL